MPYILKGYIYIRWYSTCTHTVYAHDKTGCAFFYAVDCMYSMSVLCIYACMYLYILSLSVVFFKYKKMSNQIEIIIFIDFSICFQLIEIMMNMNILQLQLQKSHFVIGISRLYFRFKKNSSNSQILLTIIPFPTSITR